MDDDSSESRFREGAVIAGKYSLTHTLGRGGMGLVVAATHLQLERPVAIKFLLPEHLAKADVVGRFTREARSAAKIQNDHVAHVLDVGVDEGTPYMVMEYLEGEDLKQVLSRRGPLSVEETVKHVMQACEALAEAHALGIVHRDLKPANLFLANRANGRSILKVLDFGISKIMNPATETELTLTSRAVGSPSYMSPEQLTASRSLDARADVWALGVVLYELMSRRRPFYGESMPSIVAQILRGHYEKLDVVRPDLPEGIVAVVHKCLELEPDRRFASVVDLAMALSPFAPTDSLSAIDGIPRPRASSRTSLLPGEESLTGHGQTGIASVVTAAARPPRRAPSKTLLAAIGAGAFAVMLAIGGFTMRRGSPVTPAVAARAGTEVAAAAAAVPSAVPAAATSAPSAAPADVGAAPRAIPSSTPSAHVAVDPAPSAIARHDPPASIARAPIARAAKTSSSPPSAPSVASASAPVCHLVSYFDAVGDKHFKQECQ